VAVRLQPAFDVAVVGGGLVGTALAYEMVTAGAKVVLIDRHDPGPATDAGAGILSPPSIGVEDPAWFGLAMAAGSTTAGWCPRSRRTACASPGTR